MAPGIDVGRDKKIQRCHEGYWNYSAAALERSGGEVVVPDRICMQSIFLKFKTQPFVGLFDVFLVGAQQHCIQ
jgi:hypothetical protein